MNTIKCGDSVYQTEFGSFDGNGWDTFCQKCLKLRHINEGYQSIDAHFGGDLGIEGYTRTGLVFQCYCPDEEYDPKNLYKHQRSKITRDLKKLITYQDQLLQILGGVRIKKWIFVTPKNLNRDLVLHCVTKRDEYRAKNLPHLDQDFDVLIQDADYLIEQARIVLEQTNRRLLINSEEIKDETAIQWAESEVESVQNTTRKLTATYPTPHSTDVVERIQRLTAKRIEYFIKGSSVINKLRKMVPEQYERFVAVVDSIETDVEDKCMYPSEDNQKFFREIESLVSERLSREFGNTLDSITVSHLERWIISDWLMRCPLDFIGEESENG